MLSEERAYGLQKLAIVNSMTAMVFYIIYDANKCSRFQYHFVRLHAKTLQDWCLSKTFEDEVSHKTCGSNEDELIGLDIVYKTWTTNEFIGYLTYKTGKRHWIL